MRFIALFVAMSALSQTVVAETPECRSLADPGARLTCYDKVAPPAASTPKPVSAKVPASKVDPEKYVDTISAEDVLMNAKLKNICRGC